MVYTAKAKQEKTAKALAGKGLGRRRSG